MVSNNHKNARQQCCSMTPGVDRWYSHLQNLQQQDSSSLGRSVDEPGGMTYLSAMTRTRQHEFLGAIFPKMTTMVSILQKRYPTSLPQNQILFSLDRFWSHSQGTRRRSQLVVEADTGNSYEIPSSVSVIHEWRLNPSLCSMASEQGFEKAVKGVW